MLEDLMDDDKIYRTNETLIPNFLRTAINDLMQTKEDVQLITARHDFKLSKTLQCPIYKKKYQELKDDIASDFDYEPTFRVGETPFFISEKRTINRGMTS
jgi:hypothetical protein